MKQTSYSPIIAIDTSGSFCSVAVSFGDGRVFHQESEGAGDHFERLPNLVQTVCLEAGIVPADLVEIRVGSGPGSFTGLRIGFSFAKGFAMARRIPLRAFSSFYGAAAVFAQDNLFELNQREQGRDINLLVISDARRDEVFVGEYRIEHGSVIEVSSPVIESVVSITTWIDSYPKGSIITPIRDFRPPLLPGCVVQSGIAKGIVGVIAEAVKFAVGDVSDIAPDYLRAVAAKTIAERTPKSPQ